MEKGSAITNYLKDATKSLMFGVAKSALGSNAVVPALAPIPVDQVDTSFGSLDTIEKPEDEEKYQEVVKEKIAKVAEEKSLPYEEEPEVSLKKGGIVKDRTIAEVAEGGEAEAVIPMSKYGDSIESIYREGASLLISSSIGFLQTLPASPAKGSVLAEANKLKSVFGISKTVKPAFKIGLKQELQWWGGVGGGAATGGAMAPEEKKKESTSDSGGGGFRVGSLTTTNRGALSAADGEIIYNSTNGMFEIYQRGAWQPMTKGAAVFNVTNNGASDYTFSDAENHWFPTSTNDPVLYLRRGETYYFVVNASSHPFEIRQSNGGSAYSTGVTNNTQQSGTITFKVPMSAPSTLYYQCTAHSGMGNTINIV